MTDIHTVNNLWIEIEARHLFQRIVNFEISHTEKPLRWNEPKSLFRHGQANFLVDQTNF